jgi:transcriptional regulator with XRE-family HTH domain
MIRLQIKELAKAKGMKQYELADRSGVTPQLLNRYWNNNIQRVDLEELNKIAIALGVKPGELIISEGGEQPAA